MNERDSSLTYTPIMYACKFGRLDTIKCLVENGANANHRFDNGFTSLHSLCRQGYDLKTIKCLIENGADIDMRDSQGKVPLHYACVGGDYTPIADLETVKYLVENGADVNAMDAFGKTPFDIAREEGNSGMVDYLKHKNVKRFKTSE